MKKSNTSIGLGIALLAFCLFVNAPYALTIFIWTSLSLSTFYLFFYRVPTRVESRSHPRLKKLHLTMSYTLVFFVVAALFLAPDMVAQDSGGAVMAKSGNFLPATTTTIDKLLSFFGIGVMVSVAFAWNRVFVKTAVNWRTVAWGIGLQLLFAVIVLKTPGASDFFFNQIDGSVKQLLSFSEKGADFVFQTVEPHWAVTGFNPGADPELFIGRIAPAMKSFAFWILPTIVFFSSLMTVLYHLQIMQHIVKVFAKIMQKTMRTSGSESLSAAANIFVGQTEAPLVVKPFIQSMTKSELHAVMTGGFATVAGGVMAAYVSFLKDIPGIAGHLVTASIMSAPAALAISKVMYPETEESPTAGDLKMSVERPDGNVVEAAARGASEGMTLMLNVMAMLIAFVGIVAMADWAISLYAQSMASWSDFSGAVVIIAVLSAYAHYYNKGTPGLQKATIAVMLITIAIPMFIMAAKGVGARESNLAEVLGIMFSPFAWSMGVPWANGEALVVGRLLGEKMVLTEFIAYINLGGLINGTEAVISERSAIIASYALCGFANFASIGIQIGGIGGIAPDRRGDLAKLGLSGMIGGTLAAFMTGTIAGILL